MLHVTLEGGQRLQFADPTTNTGVGITFQRTLRIPDDGKKYPLPPGLGAFPIRRVAAYADRVPKEWLTASGVFIPMYQREAMWINFSARHWKSNALKVAAGKINAVSGKPWDQLLHPTERGWRKTAQDYLVCPPQPWLDGFNTGNGSIRQFVAMPLGMGYTVEGQLTGKEEHGGIQLIVYEPKPGRFPDQPPPAPARELRCFETMSAPACAAPKSRGGFAMGLAAGGTIEQKIYPDPHGYDTWDATNFGRVFVHIVNSVLWREITGEALPATPVSPLLYTAQGYPWFKLYEEDRADLPPADEFAAVKSVAAKDAQHGFVGVDDERSFEVPAAQCVGLARIPSLDGQW